MGEWWGQHVAWRFRSTRRAALKLFHLGRRIDLEGAAACTRCAQPVDDTRFKLCGKCREYARKWALPNGRKKAAAWVAAGRCSKCGKPNEDAGEYRMCRPCRESGRKRDKRRGPRRARSSPAYGTGRDSGGGEHRTAQGGV